MRQYQVQYVVIGDLERVTYPGDGLAKFDNLGERVFENYGTTIYKANVE